MHRPLLRLFLAAMLAIAAVAAWADELPACKPETRAERIGAGTIAYDVIGEGPTVVLVHGIFADKGQWTALACLIAAAGHRAIAVDLPGYGASTGFPLSVYRLEREVALLHALLQRLAVERFDLAGNSMGGAIAALYARRYPGAVKSLAFLGSPLGVVHWHPDVKEAIYRGTNPFVPVSIPELDLELQLLFVTPPAIPADGKQAIVERNVRDNRHYVRVWNIVNLYGDVLASSIPARAPTLIVWGDDDRIFAVAGAERLHRRIPGSEVRRLQHAGHLLHLENAAEVAPIYVDFLRRASAESTQPAKQPEAAATIRAQFACDAGKSIDAVFVNGPRSSVELALSDGRKLALPQALSASGARYANPNETFVFWNKGNTAFIEENGTTTYAGCTTRR